MGRERVGPFNLWLTTQIEWLLSLQLIVLSRSVIVMQMNVFEVCLCSLGDKVTLNPAISCGHCTLCRADAATLCETTKFLGLASNYYGGLMEAIVHPARFVYK